MCMKRLFSVSAVILLLYGRTLNIRTSLYLKVTHVVRLFVMCTFYAHITKLRDMLADVDLSPLLPAMIKLITVTCSYFPK